MKWKMEGREKCYIDDATILQYNYNINLIYYALGTVTVQLRLFKHSVTCYIQQKTVEFY